MTYQKLNSIISALLKARESLPDDLADECKNLYPEWRPGVSYTLGERVLFEEKLYKVITSHTSIEGWKPTDTPSLFAPILAGQEGTEIGEWTQPDSTNPYMKGDKVTFEGKTYESTIDGNVWAPNVYGWVELS